MELRIEKATHADLALLEEMENNSFNTNLRYFPDGILPGYSDDDHDRPTYEAMLADPTCTILKIMTGIEVAGGAYVNDLGNGIREIEVFFISTAYIGQGIGAYALKLVEDYFPDTKIWRLITPTQVMKNIVFYVNKCGYHIVKIVGYDREKECGDYVFEKVVSSFTEE